MAILSGWKQIASYLRQGVRTVQRWEEFGLPVHRPQGRGQSSVIAITEEIDEWTRHTPQELNEINQLKSQIAKLEHENTELRVELGQRPVQTIILKKSA